MDNNSKWSLTAKEKDEFISELTSELVMLRTKAEVSQEELAELIGISRQTYGAVERGTRKMSWSTFLSLVLFFACNQKTHDMLCRTGAIPRQIMQKFNEDAASQDVDLSLLFGEDTKLLIDNLDERAISSIRAMIMLEYARCTSTPGDAVVKSFDGVDFTLPKMKNKNEIAAVRALKTLKERDKHHDQP